MDIKKIIKGLRCCSSTQGAQGCYGCPYAYAPENLDPDYDCSNQVLKEAIKALEEVENERSGV